MEVKEGYMLLVREQNRSRPSLLHIIPSKAETRDACLCGLVLLGVNKWEIADEAGDLRVSKRCLRSYEKRIKFDRWKR